MTLVNRGIGRAIALAGLAAVAAAALGACSAGQVTQTSDQVAPVPGFSASAPAPSGGTVGIRNSTIAFDPKGYAKGGRAPLQIWLYNESASAVDVEITSTDAASVTLLGTAPAPAEPTASPSAPVSASPAPPGPSVSVSASPGATQSPSASPSPTESKPAGKPAKITIPAAGFVILNANAGNVAWLNGLTRQIRPGESANVTFTFSNGAVIPAVLPVAIPLTPLPRVPLEGLHSGE